MRWAYIVIWELFEYLKIACFCLENGCFLEWFHTNIYFSHTNLIIIIHKYYIRISTWYLRLILFHKEIKWLGFGMTKELKWESKSWYKFIHKHLNVLSWIRVLSYSQITRVITRVILNQSSYNSSYSRIGNSRLGSNFKVAIFIRTVFM